MNLQFAYTWLTDTSISDPGSGKVKCDVGSNFSVGGGFLSISETEGGGLNLTDLFNDIQFCPNKYNGVLRIVKTTDSSKWALGYLGVVVDNGGWRKMVFEPIIESAVGTLFANNDPVTLEFTLGGTAPYYEQTGVKVSNYTALMGDHVLCDANSAAGSFTVSLPASPFAGVVDTIVVTLVDEHASRVVDIDRNGQLVNGGTDTSSLRLVLKGDRVEFKWMGSTIGWVATPRLQAHFGEVVRASAQSIPLNTDTKIAWDTALNNVGGIADLTNDWIQVRRAGKYLISASIGLDGDSNVGAGEPMNFRLRKFSGASSVAGDARYAAYDVAVVNEQTLNAGTAVTASLAAGDKIEMWYAQAIASPRNTETSAHLRPQLSVMELR